jgi:23S rRNA U2552 (ribose-2'-O)-methylase RlmE/FtsJ
MKNKYNNNYYKTQIPQSYKSAKVILNHLSLIIKPKSIIDVGCGRGAWLKVFKEQGARTLFGLDGPWNSQKKMISQDIKFISTDLEKPFKISRKFEVAICLETAEHLSPEVAKSFVKNLTNLSNVIVFGAASPFQGGRSL